MSEEDGLWRCDKCGAFLGEIRRGDPIPHTCMAYVPLAEVERWKAMESAVRGLDELAIPCSGISQAFWYVPAKEFRALRAALGSKP